MSSEFSKKQEKEVPASVSRWKKLAADWDALGTFNELGSPQKVQSASKFEYKHFLGLRVIYEKPRNRSTLPAKITKQFALPTDARLSSLYGWNAYLQEIEKFGKSGHTKEHVSQTCVPKGLGALGIVWQFQRHVILGDDEPADMNKITVVSPVASRTRTKTTVQDQYLTPSRASNLKEPSLSDQAAKLTLEDDDIFADDAEGNSIDEDEYFEDDAEPEREPLDDDPRDGFYIPARISDGRLIGDEQTVNVFLLTLLSAITHTTVPYRTRWVAERNALMFRKNVRYVARTDGHLRNEHGKCFSLIEVKPRKRANDVAIRVQESAQMAAWISHNAIVSHDPEKDCRIFILSQDKDEIYVTFPYFSDAYGRDDKKAADLKEVDFLRMREYGPFLLDSKKDVNYIASFLHAYTLHVSKP